MPREPEPELVQGRGCGLKRCWGTPRPADGSWMGTLLCSPAPGRLPPVRSLSLSFFHFLDFPRACPKGQQPNATIDKEQERSGWVPCNDFSHLHNPRFPSPPVAWLLSHSPRTWVLAPCALHLGASTTLSPSPRSTRPAPESVSIVSGAPSHLQPRVVTDSIIRIARRNMTALPAPGASLKRDVYG